MKELFGWLKSVRSIIAVLVAVTVCWLAITGVIDGKDFLGIAIIVFNFYYLNKTRPSNGSKTAAVFFLAAGLLLPGVVMADDTPPAGDAQIVAEALQSNTAAAIVKKLPAVKSGIGYSVLDNKINFLSTIQVAAYKNVNFEIGYAGDAENTGNKIVGVVSYKLLALKDYLTVPVLDLIECNVGAYYGIGNLGAGNEQDYGITATAINLKF